MDRTRPCPFCQRKPVEEHEHHETCPRYVEGPKPRPTLGDIVDLWVDGDDAALDQITKEDERRRARAAGRK
jgi:hypothetical protein